MPFEKAVNKGYRGCAEPSRQTCDEPKLLGRDEHVFWLHFRTHRGRFTRCRRTTRSTQWIVALVGAMAVKVERHSQSGTYPNPICARFLDCGPFALAKNGLMRRELHLRSSLVHYTTELRLSDHLDIGRDPSSYSNIATRRPTAARRSNRNHGYARPSSQPAVRTTRRLELEADVMAIAGPKKQKQTMSLGNFLSDQSALSSPYQSWPTY